MIFEMTAVEMLDNTVQWRTYTTSQAKANQFRKTPPMQGILGPRVEFRATEHEGKKLPKLVPYIIGRWVQEHSK